MTAHTVKPWLLRAITALVGVVLGVVLFASVRWVFDKVHPPGATDRIQDQTRAYQAWTQGPCYRIDHDRLVRVLPPQGPTIRAEDPGAGFPRNKPPGVRRIVVVGESTGEMLERTMAGMIERVDCGHRVELLQCSASGSLPEMAVRRANEALAWSPDVIVVAIGHNFMLPGPSAPATEARDPAAMGRDAYDAILQHARPQGVAVVALVLASNLWFRPQDRSAYVTSPERATAWVQWARGDLHGAIATLTPTPTSTPTSTGGHDSALRAYERAVFRAHAGAWEDARRDLEIARDLEPNPVRASTATTTAITEAARRGGARILDVDTLFRPTAEHGILGWDIFFDNCHPNPEPLDRLSRAVLQAAVPDAAPACLGGSRPLPTPEQSAARLFLGTVPGSSGDAQRLYQGLVDGPSRVYIPDSPEGLDWTAYPDNGGWRRLIDGPFAGVLRLPPGEAHALVERYDREVLGRYAPSVQAIALDAIAGAANDAGQLDLARWCLERSAAVAPSAHALVDLALIHLHAHEEAAARADLDRASRLKPSDVWTLNILNALATEPAPH